MSEADAKLVGDALWAKLKQLEHDNAQLEQRIEEQDVELQQARTNLANARAAMAEVQGENRALLAHDNLPKFLPPCELKSMERGVYEELVDDNKRIEQKPTRELRLLLRQPFPGEVIEGSKFVLKMIPVWVPR